MTLVRNLNMIAFFAAFTFLAAIVLGLIWPHSTVSPASGTTETSSLMRWCLALQRDCVSRKSLDL